MRGVSPRVSKIPREAENNQPSVKVVRYIGTGATHRMDAIKITHLAHVGSQSLVQLLHHLIGVSLDADKGFSQSRRSTG